MQRLSDNGGAAGACVPRVPLPPTNHGGAAIALPYFDAPAPAILQVTMSRLP